MASYPIQLGVTCTLFKGECKGAGTKSIYFNLNEGVESALVSLFVETVAGSLHVKVYTLTEEGKELEVIDFPVISAPTTELLLRRPAAGMQRYRVEYTCSDDATFEIRAKGLSTGQLSAKIEGSDDWQVQNTTITSTSTLLIGADLNDRNGLLIRNANFTGVEILQVAESSTKLDAGIYASVLPGESIQPDLKAGNEVWARSSGADIRVEIVEVN